MKNILKNTKVYLAGNMEYTNDATNWRSYVAKELEKLEIKVLSPLDTMFMFQNNEADEDRKKLKLARENEDYEYVHNYMRGVVQKDLRLIDLSDYIIVNLEIQKPTFGTMHEIVIADQQKKPIFLIVNNKKQTPLWLMGLLQPHYIYNTIDEALEMIKKIDSGIKPIDLRRWRLLLPEYR